MALADMGSASPRMYGGIGFALAEPSTVLAFSESDQLELVGFEKLDASATEHARNVCAFVGQLSGPTRYRVELRAHPPQHVGFGSKTALVLGILTGLNALFRLGLDRMGLQAMSGRGGASGVGIHTFFDGGVIWDGGHSRATATDYVPSRAAIGRPPPPRLARLAVPESWRVALVLPPDPGVSGERECEFFAKNAPIPRDEALETMAILCQGIMPAFALADLAALADAVQALHSVGFKARELAARCPRTRQMLAELHCQRFAAGMSSMGPLIYVLVERSDDAAECAIRAMCRTHEVEYFGVMEGNNSGYDIKIGAAT